MTKNKLVADFIQWVLMLSLSGLCLLLYLNGQSIEQKSITNQPKIVSNIDKEPSNSIIIKYRLISDGDTIYINRKLAPIDDKVYSFVENKGNILVTVKHISLFKPKLSNRNDLTYLSK